MTLPLPGPTSSGPYSMSLSLAGLLAATTNALVTSLATATTPTVLTTTRFDGALGPAPVSTVAPTYRAVTVTTAAHAGSYTVGTPNAITVKGSLRGVPVTDTLALVATGGGETIKGAQLFDTITEIDIPPQNDALGAFTFGLGDLGVPYTRAIAVGSPGTLHVGYGAMGTSDTIPTSAVTAEPLQPINVTRIYADSTAQNLTLYF